MSTTCRLEPHQFTPYADALHICTHCDGGEYAECHVAPLPEQPTREGGGEWHVEQVLPGEPRAVFDSQNRLIATAISGDLAARIITDHARAALVPELTAALREVLNSGIEFDGHAGYVVMQVDRDTLAQCRDALDAAAVAKERAG